MFFDLEGFKIRVADSDETNPKITSKNLIHKSNTKRVNSWKHNFTQFSGWVNETKYSCCEAI